MSHELTDCFVLLNKGSKQMRTSFRSIFFESKQAGGESGLSCSDITSFSRKKAK